MCNSGNYNTIALNDSVCETISHVCLFRSLSIRNALVTVFKYYSSIENVYEFYILFRRKWSN